MSARHEMRRLAKSAYNHLSDEAKNSAKRVRDGLRGIDQLHHNMSLLALRLAELEAKLEPERRVVPEVADDHFPEYVRSRLCTQAAWDQPYFADWCERIGVPAQQHRKTWEFAYIARMLELTGCLQPGKRGVGFGVGREPLVSAFASLGVEILATDLDPGDREAQGWIESGQHAVGEDAGLRTEKIDKSDFEKLVTWRAVDMRNIPRDIGGYDFTWSTCALEHLGSLQAGLDFVTASLGTLVPGGIAVHTTEFNLSSNEDTIESGATVVYRRRDIEDYVAALEAEGHQVAALDFNQGSGLLDHYVDVPPYLAESEPTLRFRWSRYSLTSIALVVRKKAEG
ncbi:MAG: hypothetical protein NVSMB48_21580 [Marmoricola sp.]